MREPPVKKVLYWCEECNVPLLAKSCACGREGKRIELLQPYDLRPALSADRDLIIRLVRERYGDIPLAKILLLNKTGGVDRAARTASSSLSPVLRGDRRAKGLVTITRRRSARKGIE